MTDNDKDKLLNYVIENFRPIDDKMMNVIFKNNIPLIQRMIQIILDKQSLVITSLSSQNHIDYLIGRKSVILDIKAVDDDGKIYNIEMQRNPKGAVTRRARYHHSVIDVNEMDKSNDYMLLPDCYVIFITETDTFHDGKLIHKFCMYDVDNEKYANDGQYTVYLNTDFNYDDVNTDLLKLIHDIREPDPKNMYLSEFKQAMKYCKSKHIVDGKEEYVMRDLIISTIYENLDMFDSDKQESVKRLIEAERRAEEAEERYNIADMNRLEAERLKNEAEQQAFIAEQDKKRAEQQAFIAKQDKERAEQHAADVEAQLLELKEKLAKFENKGKDSETNLF